MARFPRRGSGHAGPPPHLCEWRSLRRLVALGVRHGHPERDDQKWVVADLATDVMTLTMTALSAESSLSGGDNQRWQRRSASVGIFAVSATFGAFLVRFGVLWPVLLVFLILWMALAILLLPGARRPDSASGRPLLRSGPGTLTQGVTIGRMCHASRGGSAGARCPCCPGRGSEGTPVTPWSRSAARR